MTGHTALRVALIAALVVWGAAIVRQRWQAAGVEIDRQRANRNPMVRKDDR